MVRFDELLRAQLPEFDGDALMPDTDLRGLGLDSMGAVKLMFELEAAFGVVFPDESITPSTFDTPRALLTALAAAGAAIGDLPS